MKYLHNYDTVSHFEETYEGTGYTEPWVSYTQENDHVDYNKNTNWARISYADGAHFGSGYYVNLDDVGETFNNTLASTYYVYDEGTDTETEYRGVRLYWERYGAFLHINDIPCGGYRFINYDGSNWIMDYGSRQC